MEGLETVNTQVTDQPEGTQPNAESTPANLEQPEGNQLNSEQENGQDQPNQDQPNQPEQDKIANWLEDGRAKTMWLGEDGNPDPNKLFQSYKELETKFSNSPERQQLEELNQQHETVVGELEQAKSIVEQVDAIMSHPDLGPKIQQLLDEHEQSELRNRYGDLSPERLESLRALEQKTKELESWKQETELKAKETESFNIAQSEMKKIDALAKEYGIPWEKQNQSAFVQHCINNQVSPSMMEAEFYRQAKPQLEKHYKALGEQIARQNLGKGQEATISGGGENRQTSNEGMSLKEEVTSVLEG